MIVDGKDYHLDLLFYHRGMRCLVVIELKTRDLEPADFGQMTLYLRFSGGWLRLSERCTLADVRPYRCPASTRLREASRRGFARGLLADQR